MEVLINIFSITDIKDLSPSPVGRGDDLLLLLLLSGDRLPFRLNDGLGVEQGLAIFTHLDQATVDKALDLLELEVSILHLLLQLLQIVLHLLHLGKLLVNGSLLCSSRLLVLLNLLLGAPSLGGGLHKVRGHALRNYY